MKKILCFASSIILLLCIGVSAYASDSDNNDCVGTVTENSTDYTVTTSYYDNDGNYVFQSDENMTVAYQKTESGIDIIGKVDEQWRMTSCWCPIKTYVKVGANIFRLEENQLVVVSGDSEADPGLTVNVTPSIVADGKLVDLTYEVTNITNDDISYSIAGYSDSMFNGNDYCPIVNVGEVCNGSAFALQDTTENGNTISFAVIPIDADTSNYFCYWEDRLTNIFLDGQNAQNSDGESINYKLNYPKMDSAYGYSWVRTIAAGAKQIFNSLTGVGNLEDIKNAAEQAKEEITGNNIPDYVYIPPVETIVNLPQYFNTSIFDGIVKNEAMENRNYTSEADIQDNQLKITANLDGDVSVRKLILSHELISKLKAMNVESVLFIVGDVEYVIYVNELVNYSGDVVITVNPLSGEVTIG